MLEEKVETVMVGLKEELSKGDVTASAFESLKSTLIQKYGLPYDSKQAKGRAVKQKIHQSMRYTDDIKLAHGIENDYYFLRGNQHSPEALRDIARFSELIENMAWYMQLNYIDKQKPFYSESIRRETQRRLIKKMPELGKERILEVSRAVTRHFEDCGIDPSSYSRQGIEYADKLLQFYQPDISPITYPNSDC